MGLDTGGLHVSGVHMCMDEHACMCACGVRACRCAHGECVHVHMHVCTNLGREVRAHGCAWVGCTCTQVCRRVCVHVAACVSVRTMHLGGCTCVGVHGHVCECALCGHACGCVRAWGSHAACSGPGEAEHKWLQLQLCCPRRVASSDQGKPCRQVSSLGQQ